MSNSTHSTLSTTARTEIPSGDDHELDALRSQQEQDAQGLATLLDQVHHAQKSLATASKRLRTAESRAAAAQARALADLGHDRDRLSAEAEKLRSERDTAAGELSEARDTLRTLAAALLAIEDPLAPLTDEDDDLALASARESLESATSGKTSPVGAALAAARELVETLTTRVALQAKRVQLLRDQVGALEADNAAGDQARQALDSRFAAAEADLAQTRAALEEVRQAVAAGEEERGILSSKLERTTTTGLESEAKALAEREALSNELKIARERGDSLAQQRKEIIGLLRKAERAGVDLAQALVDLADHDIAAGSPIDLPGLNGQRDELAHLVGDASNAIDDEVDGLFRHDIGEDLATAARHLVDGVGARRSALLAGLESARSDGEHLAAQLQERGDQLVEAQDKAKVLDGELDRTRAQLGATRSELEARSKDLAASQQEITGLKAETARLVAEVQSLNDKLAKAREVKVELDRTRDELAAAKRELERQNQRAQQWELAQQSLARQLVELAAAADSGLAVGNLKHEGFVGRFTKTVSRLEGETGRAGGDPLVLIKSSTEVVDKLTARVAQLAAELQRRGDALSAKSEEANALEHKAEDLAKQLTAQLAASRKLEEQRAEQERIARKLPAAEEKAAKTATDLAQTSDKLKTEAAAARQLKAELEELRARSDEESAGAIKETAELKRRLAEEQKSRRVSEQAAAQAREELDAALAAAQARLREAERGSEERESRLVTLSAESAALPEARRRVHDLQTRLDAANKTAQAANERVRALESELADRADGGAQLEQLAAVQRERDQAAARLRSAEKRLAEEQGAAGGLKAQVDALKRQIDAAKQQHRAELQALQERLDAANDENGRLAKKAAGLNAKVKTLTSV